MHGNIFPLSRAIGGPQRARRRAAPRRPLLPLLLIAALLPLYSGGAAAKHARRKLAPREGPTDASLEARGILDPQIAAADLAETAREYGSATFERRFNGPVLGYVTPWNRGGYDAAVKFRGKLTHVSPVWYQLRLDPEGHLALVGAHEFNASWIDELRAPPPPGAAAAGGDAGGGEGCGEGEGGGRECKNPAAGGQGRAPPLVVPRVIIELDGRGVGLLLGRPGPAIDRLVQEVTKRGYDGIVLECWQAWARAFEHEDFKASALGFMKQLGANLVSQNKVLILAVPPPLPAAPGRPHADTAALASLADVVAGFSVMTYDHLASVPGFNGPLPWQRQNLELLLEEPGASGGAAGGPPRVAPRQVLLGLNFYGYEFARADDDASAQWSADPVTADRFLGVLSRFQPKLNWDEKAQEHFVKFKDGGKRRQIYFPTPASLDARVRLAQEWGAGLSIWELGQGMDSLFDAL